MAVVSMFNTHQAIFGIGAFLVLYYVYWELLTTRASRRRMIQLHRCKPVKKFPMADPVLELDLLLKDRKAVFEHRNTGDELGKVSGNGCQYLPDQTLGADRPLTLLSMQRTSRPFSLFTSSTLA